MRDADQELAQLQREGIILDAATEAAYRAVLAADTERPQPLPRVEKLARRKKAK